MFPVLIFITLRHWQRHKLRIGLTLLGIILGASVYFAMRTANATLLGSLRLTVEMLAGKATLQITAGEAGFPEEILKVARSTPGVDIAEPIVEVVAHTPFQDDANLLIIGIDSTGDQKLREYQFDKSQTEIESSLDFITTPNSILVSRLFADKHGLKIGDELPLYTSQGKRPFIVRGIFKPSGIGEVFGGQIAIMDVYSAQDLFGRGNNFDRIDIKTQPDVAIEEVERRLRERLPAGLQVTRPTTRGKNIETAVETMSQGFLITSLVALLVGVFIIFNSFSIAVNQRWKEIAILRTLGVERFNVQRIFLNEAILLGLIGSLIGIAFGYGLAVGTNQIMMSIAATTYGLLSTPTWPVFHLGYALEALVLGVGASVVAAWLPAQSAAQLNPALALHNVESRHKDSILRFAKMPVGIVMLVAGVALVKFTAPRVGVILQFGYAALILFGIVLMLPKMSAWMARGLRPIMDRLFGSEGALAVDSIVRAPLRTSATVGALMIGLGFVFSTGAFIQSQKHVIMRSINNELTSDLYIATSDMTRSRTYHFDEELGRRIAEVPGVKRIENLRFTFVPYGGDNVALMALEMDGWFARVEEIIQEGDEQKARQLVPKGEGILISHNFMTRWGVKVGDELRLETPNGTLVRPILGTVEDYSSEKGTIIMDRALYKSYWGDKAVDFFDVNLNPGVDRDAVKAAIERLLADNQRAFVYTNREYKQWIIGIIDQFFTLNYGQMAIAIFVAAIGIINTLIISVSERKREIGVMRAIGGVRRQVRKMVLLEAIALAFIGISMGVFKSLFDTYFLVRTASSVLTGYSVPYDFPGTLVLMTIPIVILIGIVAAWGPAQKAIRLNIVEAIGYE
jgi:putative ABC transport system permease protein